MKLNLLSVVDGCCRLLSVVDGCCRLLSVFKTQRRLNFYSVIMTSEEKAEQLIKIKFCVELGKTPMETKTILKTTGRGSDVSRALVYRWYKRFTEGRTTPYDDLKPGRPSVIDSKRKPDAALFEMLRYCVTSESQQLIEFNGRTQYGSSSYEVHWKARRLLWEGVIWHSLTVYMTRKLRRQTT